MKNVLVVLSGLIITAFSNSILAAPEKPYYAGGSWGTLTADIGTHYSEWTVDTFSNDPINNPATGDTTLINSYQTGDSKNTAITLYGGYSISDSLAVELQYMTSMGADDVFNDEDPTFSSWTDEDFVLDFSATAVGAYAVFNTRSKGDAFIAARIGLAVSDIKFQSDAGSVSTSEAFLSWGISFGQKIGPGDLEFMYMRYPDVDMKGVDTDVLLPYPESNPMPNTGSDDRFTKLNIGETVTLEVLSIGYVYRF